MKTGAVGPLLSLAEQRMWLLDQMSAGSPAYTISVALELRGELDTEALDRAWCTVVARHDVLRTRYPVVGIEPVAIIEPTPSTVVERLDTLLEPSRCADESTLLRQIVDGEAKRVFDLGHCPPYVVRLWKVSPQRTLMTISLHHIIADGWSISLLLREVATAYNNRRRSNAMDLPSLPLTYRAFANQQRSSGDFADQLAVGRKFWRTQLAGLPPNEFPTSRGRGAAQSFVGESIWFDLPQAVFERTASLARSCNSTASSALFAAFASLVACYAGQQDVVLGVPFANRGDPAIEGVVGLFVNVLPLRIAVTETANFVDVVRSAQDAIIDALEYQQVPLDAIVDEVVGEGRSASRNPIFQIMFAVQTQAGELPKFDGLTVGRLIPNIGATRFDLEMTVWLNDAAPRFRLTFNRDLFEASFIHRLGRHYIAFLRSVLDKPQAPLAECEFLSSQDEAFAAVHCEPCPTQREAQTLGSLFSAQVKRTPERTAISWDTGSATYTALETAATAVAQKLIDRAIAPGDVVAVCTGRNLELCAAILGIIKAGAVFLPLDPTDPVARREFMLKDSGAIAVLTDQRTADRVEANVVPIQLDVLTCMEDGAAGRHDLPNVDSSNAAYIIYTSGSTGLPKGVLIRHSSVCNTLLACKQEFGFRPDDIMPVMASQAFDIFLFELFSMLISGGRAILLEKTAVVDPVHVAGVLREITCLQAVPGLMRRLLAALQAAGYSFCPLVRQVTTGGDAVPSTLLRELQQMFPAAEISVTYGPTEAAIICSRYVVPPSGPEGSHPIGRPLPGVRLSVEDASGGLRPPGCIGEIVIAGPCVATGYINRPEQTAKSFMDQGNERRFRTGDMGRWRSDGVLEFEGRLDHQVKIRGFRVELGEVEATLDSHEKVKSAACALRGKPEDAFLAAYVVPRCEPDALAALEGEHVEQWRTLFEVTHKESKVDVQADFTGWRNSFTREPFSTSELEQWVDGTIASIRSYFDNDAWQSRSLRILEIGCGTGLLLTRLAPSAGFYIGTDFSSAVLLGLRDRLKQDVRDRVRLLEAPATEIPPAANDLDLVILNSVTQYLPSATYLQIILEAAAKRLRPAGVIYVGDVRSLPLLHRFYQQLAPSETDPARLTTEEHELLLAPRFFYDFAASRLPDASVSALPRRYCGDNEMSRFRYEVTIRLNAQPAVRGIAWQPWPEEGEPAVAQLLMTTTEDLLGFVNIPNARLLPESERDRAVDPDQLRDLVDQEWSVQTSWLRGADDGSFDAAFIRRRDVGTDCTTLRFPIGTTTNTANRPLLGRWLHSLRATLRDHLEASLPDYMVPNAIEFLDALPLTENGKLDRSALPEPRRRRSTETQPCTSEAEIEIAGLWQQMLSVPEVFASDDFFRLGGNSLLAMEFVIRMRQRNRQLLAQDVFMARTVEKLAAITGRASRPVARPNRDVSAKSPGGIGDLIRPNSRPLRSDSTVLLAGATGYLGIHLLTVLRNSVGCRVLCLLRGEQESATRRLRDRYDWYFGEGSYAAIAQRIQVISGDLTRRRLGLSPQNWSRIVGSCTHLINAAADVRHVAPREEVFAVNRDGTARLIELAEVAGAIFQHVSTIGVKGTSPDSQPRQLTEMDLEIGQELTESYSESKFAAETLMRDFLSRGGHGCIYRVGTVAPSWGTGRFQYDINKHFFSRYVRSTIQLGLASDWPGRGFNLNPVDVMAHAIVSVTQQDRLPQALHINTPHCLTHGQVARCLQDMGYAIRLLEPAQFITHVLSASDDEAYQRALPGILPLLEGHDLNHVGIKSNVSETYLDHIGITFPVLTNEWFAEFIEHCIERRFLPPPRHWPVIPLIARPVHRISAHIPGTPATDSPHSNAIVGR